MKLWDQMPIARVFHVNHIKKNEIDSSRSTIWGYKKKNIDDLRTFKSVFGALMDTVLTLPDRPLSKHTIENNRIDIRILVQLFYVILIMRLNHQ